MIPMKWVVFYIALWMTLAVLCGLCEGAWIGAEEEGVLESMMNVTIFASDSIWERFIGVFSPTFLIGFLKAAALDYGIFHGTWELFRVIFFLPLTCAAIFVGALTLLRLIRGGG